MEKQIQREGALAEAEGRIKEQQENEDSNRCQAILQETKVVIQASGKMCDHVGGGTLAIVTDADLLFRIAGLSSLLLLGVFSTHEASRVVGRTVERWLGTPKLVSLLVHWPSHRGFHLL